MMLPAQIGAFEVTGDEVRLAIVKTGGAQPTLLEYHATVLTYATQEDRSLAFLDAVKKMVASAKNHPALFVLCMDSQSAVVRTLTVPFRGQRRVAAAVPVELEPNLAFPIDDLVIDHIVIREAPGETEVLVVAMNETLLREQVSDFAAAGVTIEGINIDAAGLAALWLAGQRKPVGLHAQMHVRDESAIFTVVSGRKLVYFRQISVSASRFVSDSRVASRQVRNTLRAFGSAWPGEDKVVDLTVTGVDLDAEAREAFDSELNIPVLYASLGENVRGVDKAITKFRASLDTAPLAIAPSVLLDHNRWEAAAGVALCSAGAGNSFQFLKGQLAPKNPLLGLRSRLIGTAALALIAIAGSVGYCAAQYRNNKAESDRIAQQIWTIFTETFPDDPRASEPPVTPDPGGVQAMAMFEEAKAKADAEGTRVSADMLSRPPLLIILKELADKLPSNNVIITDLKIRDSRGDSQVLTISGEIKDTAGFTQALANLKESTIVHVDGDPTLSQKDDTTTFALTATI